MGFVTSQVSQLAGIELEKLCAAPFTEPNGTGSRMSGSDGSWLDDVDPIDESAARMSAGRSDQLLLEAFLRAKSRFRGAIVGISDQTMISNASASGLLGSTDRRTLRRLIPNAGGVTEGSQVRIDLANGLPVTAHCYPVGPGHRPVGVVIHISVGADGSRRVAALSGGDEWTWPGRSESSPISSLVDPTLLTGWCELTNSERTVAELVGRGLSNKETGRKLFISRHTVDSHLRRVFKKLGITSRVELARLLGEHYESLSHAVAEADGAA
jgi:DNA-binding CsgD family transcriptional regulator